MSEYPRLTLLVGPIDSGKTTTLRLWFETAKRGSTLPGNRCDGFLSVKRYEGERLIGYDLERLSTGEHCLWARHHDWVPAGREPWLEIGPYRMFEEGFAFAGRIVDDLLRSPQPVIVFDEIGPLELDGKAFAPLLQRLLDAKIHMVAAMRVHCLSDFRRRFPFIEPAIVELGAKGNESPGDLGQALQTTGQARRDRAVRAHDGHVHIPGGQAGAAEAIARHLPPRRVP